MGRIIAKKVRGMNWIAKVSLVLVFTLIFSTFMYQGWWQPTSVEAATKTTAGAVTAGATVATTVRVVMPYTGDDTTPNNTATVKWKLCTDVAYPAPNVINAVHSASPYNIDVTGLTSGTCYTLQATYNDADGVTGTNPQTIQITAGWDNTLLHNSNRFPGTTKWQAQGGWGQGGQYGQIVCETCHTKTTSNIKRIKDTTVNAPTGSFPGQTGGLTVNFQSVSSPNGFGDDSIVRTTSQKVCEYCHSITNYHRYNNSQADKTHNNNVDCTFCHPHSLGFVGSGTCDTCHGAPPGSGTDNNLTNIGPDKLFIAAHATHYDPTAGGVPSSYTAATNRSVATAYVFDCGICHSTNGADHLANQDGIVDVNLNGWGITGTFTRGGTATLNAPPPGSVTFTDTNATCSNVYCHGNFTGGSNATPTWGNTASAACGTCHGATAASPPASNSHPAHVGSTGTLQLDCAFCHKGIASIGTVSDKTKHVNKATDWNLDTTNARMGASATYKGSVSGSNSSVGSGYGSCNNTYCHGSTNPTWGGTLANSCDSCHSGQGAGTAATKNYTVEHTTKHTQGYLLACENCHSDSNSVPANRVTHVGGIAGPNQAAEVKYTDQSGTRTYGGGATTFRYSNLYASPYGATAPTPTYAPGAASAGTDTTGGLSWTTGTCNSVWCHSNANPLVRGAEPARNQYRSVTWTGTSTCTWCHLAADTNANMTAAADRLSTAHAVHVATDRYGSASRLANQVSCAFCHAATVSNNTTISTVANHVNGVKDVSFGTWADPAGTNVGGYTSPNCTNIYCHSDGQTVALGTDPASASVAWNSTTIGCGSCHGGPPAGPAYVSGGSNKTNSHGKHTVSNNAGRLFVCVDCHSSTVNAANAISDYTKHLNKVYDVSGTNITAYTYAANGGTCSATACHGNTTPKWGQTSGCNFCHPYDVADWSNVAYTQMGVESFGAHAKHIAHIKTRTGAALTPGSDVFGTGAAASVCGSCHTNTGTNHLDGARLINFGDATYKTGGAAGFSFLFDPAAPGTNPPKYNGVSGTSSAVNLKTCSNVGCHFSTTPVWSSY